MQCDSHPTDKETGCQEGTQPQAPRPGSGRACEGKPGRTSELLTGPSCPPSPNCQGSGERGGQTAGRATVRRLGVQAGVGAASFSDYPLSHRDSQLPPHLGLDFYPWPCIWETRHPGPTTLPKPINLCFPWEVGIRVTHKTKH